MKILISTFFVFFLLSPLFAEGKSSVPKTVKVTAAQQNAADQAAVLNSFVAWDKNLKTLKTDYDQITTFEGTEISSSQGRIYKKDNNIRLDSLENGKVTQSAITNKNVIKIIDADGSLITSLTWAEWQAAQPNKALFDFGNYAKILKSHKLKIFEKEKDSYKIIFDSIPPSGEDGYELEFVLDGKDFFPREISISSQGIKTRTVLKDTNKNVELKESVFK